LLQVVSAPVFVVTQNKYGVIGDEEDEPVRAQALDEIWRLIEQRGVRSVESGLIGL